MHRVFTPLGHTVEPLQLQGIVLQGHGDQNGWCLVGINEYCDVFDLCGVLQLALQMLHLRLELLEHAEACRYRNAQQDQAGNGGCTPPARDAPFNHRN